MTEQRIILNDLILPTQYVCGEERGAFWGVNHPLTDGSGPEGQEFHEMSLHNHVAVLTVRDGVAQEIEYVHSLSVTCNGCGREYDTEDEDVTLGGPCPEGALPGPYTPDGDTERGCPGGTLTGPFAPPTAIAAEPAYDFSLSDQGTILVLTALSDEAKAWVAEHVSHEGYQPDLPNSVYLEWRYLDAILDGIDGDGLTVDAIERALVR